VPPYTAVSLGAALPDNLRTLGKLQRGDMLAAADGGGRLVRKTNWITQKHNSSKTHDAALFAQIEEVLSQAEFAADSDIYPEHQVQEYRSLYAKAVKGLETLLQTYRSKGSKETDLIDRLTLVLVEHVATIEKNSTGPEAVNSLMAVAKQTIKYVQDCRIRSENNIVGCSYYGRELDGYLLMLLVRGASNVQGFGNITVRDLKTVLLDISRRPISRNEKRRLLATTLSSLFDSGDWLRHLHTMQGRDYYMTYTAAWTARGLVRNPLRNERDRHKATRRALRTRLGNCGEKTNVAATHLIEATRGAIGICRVHGKEYDHAWVLISRHKQQLIDGCRALAANGRGKQLLPRDTVVVDGWTKDWWGLRDWFNPLGNPRQLGVRCKIRSEIADNGLEVDEEVHWPPALGNSYFRLRYAHLTQMDEALLGPHFTWATYQAAVTKLKQYRATLSQVISPITLHQLVDNPDIDAVEEALSASERSSRTISQELRSLHTYRKAEGPAQAHASAGGHRSSTLDGHASVGSHHASFRSNASS